MSTPKPTPEQLMRAVIVFARKQIAAGMSADKVQDLLVKKGLNPVAAAKVMAKLASPQAQGSPQATATAVGGKLVATHTENVAGPTAHRGFGVQGRFLRLPVNRGKCTLPSACVVCGADRPVEPVVREDKKYSYGLSTGAAALWACAISLLMCPSFFSISGLQWTTAIVGLLTLVVHLVFMSRRNKLTLVYTTCATDFATRARRNFVANAVAIATWLFVVALFTLTLSRSGDHESSPVESRVAMAALASWPWLLLLNWLRLRFDGNLRIATNGKTHAFVDGCSKPFLESVGRLGVPEVVMPQFWSFSPKPGYPVASFWWTFCLLAGGLASIPMFITASGTVAQTRAIINIAHAAGSRPGEYQTLQGLRMWVPVDWQVTSKENGDSVQFLSYRLAPPDNALVLEVAVLPEAAFQDFARDDANGVRLMAEGLKQRIMSGYKASEPVATTLNGQPAQRIDVSGFIQPAKEGSAAVPITFVVLQQKHKDYIYRVYLTLHTDWVRILGPGRVSDILDWVKPALAEDESDGNASRIVASGVTHAETLNEQVERLLGKAKYAEAEPLAKQSLEQSIKKNGPDSPETATSLNNLAVLYDNQGKYDLAEPLYKRALAIREKALGPDHPGTARSLNNLAEL